MQNAYSLKGGEFNLSDQQSSRHLRLLPPYILLTHHVVHLSSLSSFGSWWSGDLHGTHSSHWVHEAYVGVVTEHIVVTVFSIDKFELIELHILSSLLNRVLLCHHLLLKFFD